MEGEILLFSQQVSFDRLEILESQLDTDESFVTFTAFLSQKERDLTFTERSSFRKENGKWKYLQGQRL